MGTRSTTHVYEINDGKTDKAALKKLKPVLSLYRQMDGYPSGHGADLADFIHNMTIVNGFGADANAGTHANGAGCFAAQLVKYLKEGIGYIYITNAKDRQEYDYHLYLRAEELFKIGKSEIFVTVKSGRKTLFDGTRDEYVKWVGEYEG